MIVAETDFFGLTGTAVECRASQKDMYFEKSVSFPTWDDFCKAYLLQLDEEAEEALCIHDLME